MSKVIPPLLQADYDQDCTTLCDLLRIENADGEVLGLTSLDRQLDYDDGDGVVTYYPDPGFEPTELEGSHDLAVDGGDGSILLPLSAMPMNAADIRRGIWDDSAIKVMRLNYEALDHGHELVLSGQFGDITLRDDALLVIQLDGNTRPLRQVMCHLDSLTCRAVAGTMEADAIEYCGKDFTVYEIAFTVTAVDGDEPDRVFTASALGQATGFFVPGIVLWDTGDNASNTVRGVDSFTSGGIVGLRDPLRFPVQNGDTGRIRIDCTKDVEGDKGCRFHNGDDWVNRIRAEPDIPMGGDAQMPGAQVGPGSGGATSQPETDEA